MFNRLELKIGMVLPRQRFPKFPFIGCHMHINKELCALEKEDEKVSL